MKVRFLHQICFQKSRNNVLIAKLKVGRLRVKSLKATHGKRHDREEPAFALKLTLWVQTATRTDCKDRYRRLLILRP